MFITLRVALMTDTQPPLPSKAKVIEAMQHLAPLFQLQRSGGGESSICIDFDQEGPKAKAKLFEAMKIMGIHKPVGLPGTQPLKGEPPELRYNPAHPEQAAMAAVIQVLGLSCSSYLDMPTCFMAFSGDDNLRILANCGIAFDEHQSFQSAVGRVENKKGGGARAIGGVSSDPRASPSGSWLPKP